MGRNRQWLSLRKQLKPGVSDLSSDIGGAGQRVRTSTSILHRSSAKHLDGFKLSNKLLSS